VVQLRDVPVVKVHGAARLVETPEEIYEDESGEECEEGQRGLEDGLHFSFTVHGSHNLYGNAGEDWKSGCERADLWEGSYFQGAAIAVLGNIAGQQTRECRVSSCLLNPSQEANRDIANINTVEANAQGFIGRAARDWSEQPELLKRHGAPPVLQFSWVI